MNHFHVFTFNSLTSQILLLTKTSPYHYNIDFSNIWKWYGKNNLLQKSFDCIFNNKQQHKIFFSLRSGPWLMVLLKYILSRENKSKEHGKRRVGAPLLLDQKKKKQSLPYGWCLNICNKTMCINLYTNNEISLNDWVILN